MVLDSKQVVPIFKAFSRYYYLQTYGQTANTANRFLEFAKPSQLFQCLHYIEQVQILSKAHNSVPNTINIKKTTYLEQENSAYFVTL